MAKYITGSATNQDDLFQQLRTHFTNNGWTEYDIINDVANNRDIVFRGSEGSPGAGNRPLIRMTGTSSIEINFKIYLDWDTGTNTGSYESNGNNNGIVVDGTAAFVFFSRINSVAMMIITKIGTTYNKVYVGFVRRPYFTEVAGVFSVTDAITTGSSKVVSVSSDPTGSLVVGQKITLYNYSHSSGAGAWEQGELVEVEALNAAPAQVTLVNVASAYDTGAILGMNPFPSLITTNGTSYQPGGTSGYRLGNPDGSYTGVTAHTTSSPTADFMGVVGGQDPGATYDRFGVGMFVWSGANVIELIGSAYHWIFVSGSSLSLEDTLERDATRDYIILGSSGASRGAIARFD